MKNRQGQAIKSKTIDVEKKIRQFSKLDNPFPYSLIKQTPIYLVVLLILDLTFGSGLIVRDYFRLSWYMLALFSLLMIENIFRRNKGLFLELYSKKIIELPSIDEKVAIVKFLEDYELWLFSKRGFVLGLFFVVGIAIPTYPVIYMLTVGASPFPSVFHWLSYYSYGNFVIVDIALAYPVGLAFWQFFVSAWFLAKFGNEFKIKAKFLDPDNSGGLRAVGNICLNNSVVILVPSIVLSGWIIISRVPGYEVLTWWTAYLQYVLGILVLLSVFVFFRPLLEIRRQMKDQRENFIRETEKAIWTIDERYRLLQNKIDTMPTTAFNDEIDAINKLKAHYQANMKAPAWPFDGTIIIKFVSSALIPILTQLGIMELILNLIVS